MKKASQIVSSLQHKPQFSKLLEQTCIEKLKSSLLLSIQNNIKYGYINNDTLYFVLTTKLNKFDIDNIINTIKMILNSPMIKESQKFCECKEINIEDVVIYTDPKPQQKVKLYEPNSHSQHYPERAKGKQEIHYKDKKLQEIADSILEIIKKSNDTTRDN
jgi:hypothetical protein